MKKRFLGFSLALLTLGFLGSCSSEEGNGLEEATVEYGFTVDVNDMELTRAGGTETTCMTLEDLIAYHEAANTSLEAKIQIKYSDEGAAREFIVPLRVVQSSDPTINDIQNPNPSLGDKRLVTDLIKLDFNKDRKFYLKSMYIRKAGTDAPLYSVVVEGSDVYNEYKDVISGCTIPAEGKELCKAKKWDKVYEGLCLHCAAGHTPGDFGFQILDLRFIKTHKIPFIVDICSNPGKEDYLGSGTIEVFKINKDITLGADLKTGVKDKDMTLVYKGNYGKYGSTDAKLGYIIFADDQRIDNDKEWYHIRLTNHDTPLNNFYIETVTKCPETQGRYDYYEYRGITVETLLKYKESAGWMASDNTLHLWFCDGYVGNTCASNINTWGDNWWDAPVEETPAE